ncbi:hypothetical protein IEQ34_018042 [Dendrobium chrysotoxum]|uniref:Uncharacterized protein n=1 Tax=Dendrobium chrysotoxum TaxID=161865 RepID=A0AAV7GDA8_DENCH|nr:hypothetical protein IEQ34_018042 [Dendrobium chrysotoxum]
MEVNRAEKYNVKICRKEIIAAAAAEAEAKSLKERFLSLSNIDLLIPHIDVGVFFCYRKPPPLLSPVNNFSSMVAKLKTSLAKALVVFYPFAGEVVANAAGEPELLCNNRGVEFIEAYADVRLDQLDFYDADGTVERKLVPKKEAEGGVLTLQATEMKCGGMILGCSFDHRISDAYAFNMFVITWAEMATDAKELSISPIFDRSLLSFRQENDVGSLEQALKLDEIYVPVSSYSPPPPPSPLIIENSDPPTISRIYYIAAKEINRLQSIASSDGLCRRTKLESFTAYLWKLIARVGKSGQVCRMGVVVDGRRRLGSSEMNAYFGNVISVSYSSLAVEEVEGMGIEELADVVHQFVAEVDREEHFRGLVDWVEEHRPEVCVSKIYIEEGLSVVVSSGRRFPIAEVDFGWGKTMLGSYHFPWEGKGGYVMPMPMSGDKGKDGDWLVYVHLLAEIVEVLETVGAGVFQPITSDYLFSSQK